MGRLLKLFKRFGGTALLIKYFRIGFLCKAILQVLITGFSNKGLEILRLSANKQLYDYLKRKYGKYIENITIDEQLNHENSNRIWVCWFQGIDKNTPIVIRRCIQSMVDNLKNKDVILLTDKNYSDYII